MIILADESVDSQIVTRLRQDGHEVVYVAEISPGISDDEVLEKANEQGAILLTADKDFGELVFHLQRLSGGVVLTRLSGLSSLTKAEIVSAAFTRYGDEMVKAFTVISPGRTRIRSQLGS
jgi:predicted nuclease of predicted toxin-antitoxin system